MQLALVHFLGKHGNESKKKIKKITTLTRGKWGERSGFTNHADIGLAFVNNN